ncbi:MAG: alkaline phosphatase family protein [Anaerolineales bacterium]|nr:alkaline phosphatase family protein [Anaerolineales bacterium]
MGYLRETYRGADQTLAAAWEAMPADTVVVAASDHGFAPTWKAVYAPHVLASAGLQPELQTANCAASDRVVGGARTLAAVGHRPGQRQPLCHVLHRRSGHPAWPAGEGTID